MEIADRCVAVLDVLGFRERVRTGKLEELADQLVRLADDAIEASIFWSYSDSDNISRSGHETLGRMLFSDSVFLWSQPVPTNHIIRRACLDGFITNLAMMIGQALVRRLPLRAGVAFGPVLVDEPKRIIIGQPIVDAYLTEGLQEWVGGALHPSFPSEHMMFQADYRVPTKEGAAISLDRAIDWIGPAYAGTRNEGDAIRNKFRRALMECADATQVESARGKYSNAIAFLEWRQTETDRGYRLPFPS